MRSWGLAALLCLSCAKPAAPGSTYAAVAFRDDVPGYQKFASEQYTLHYLRQRYDAVTYVEATATDDGQTRVLDAITAAATANTAVDVFFLSHHGRYDTWAAALDPAVRARLRLVYNTGAGDARQGPDWLRLGARAYVGHPASNVAPLFMRYFLPRWVDGKPLRDCVDLANKDTRDDLDGTLSKGVATVLDAVGGPKLDAPKLWAGTEAQLHGDSTLTVR